MLVGKKLGDNEIVITDTEVYLQTKYQSYYKTDIQKF